MKIIADECVEQGVIEQLRSDGHDVDAIAVQSSSMNDIPILARAVSENILLLTADLDFGGYVFQQHLPAPHSGIVQMRLPNRLKEHEKAAIVACAFSEHGHEFSGHFTTIEERRIRFTKLP